MKLGTEDAKRLEDIAEAAFRGARDSLPGLPDHLTLIVRSGSDVIPETGENGAAGMPAQIAWTIGPGVTPSTVIAEQLRRTLLHELNHLARLRVCARTTLMDAVIAEGLATAYERDASSTAPPWGEWQGHRNTIVAWLREIQALPPDTDPSVWLGTHPDGRRWVGMQVGTFLVDCAVRVSRKPPAAMVLWSTDQIVQMALPYAAKCALSPEGVLLHEPNGR